MILSKSVIRHTVSKMSYVVEKWSVVTILLVDWTFLVAQYLSETIR